MLSRCSKQHDRADFADRIYSACAQRRAELDIDPVGLNDLAANTDQSLKTIGHRVVAKMQSPGHAVRIAQEGSLGKSN